MSKPRSAPRTELEWTLDDVPEDAPGQATPRAEPPAPRPTRRWVTRRGVFLALLMLAGAGLGVWLAVRQGWQQLREQVAEEAAYEDAQSLAGAVDVVVAMQAADSYNWRQVRAAEAAVGLPAPLPAAHLLPSGEPPVLTDLHIVAGNVFEADVERTYVDSAGQRYTFDYTQRYRNLGPGLWERLPPVNDAPAAQATWQGVWVHATFPAYDTSLLEPLLAQVDRALVVTCAAWRCPPERTITLTVTTGDSSAALRPSRPEWEPAPGRAPYPITFDLYPRTPPVGDPLVINVPSPQRAGQPHDAAALLAMRHALTVQALLALASPTEVPKYRSDDFTAALVARAEVALGLAEPLDYAPLPETYRGPLSQWQQAPGGTATRLADQQQALALLDYALAGQPPTADGALLATLMTPVDLADWLGAVVNRPGAEVLRDWAAVVEPKLAAASTLPRAALTGLAYSCGAGAGLLRAGGAEPLAIKNNWVALQPEAVSGDGRYFAAIERISPTHTNLRLIDLSTGAFSTVDGAGYISVLGWTADDRLLYERQEDVSQEAEVVQLAQLDPLTGERGPWLPHGLMAGPNTPVWWTPDHSHIYLGLRATTGDKLQGPVVMLARVAVAGEGSVAAIYEWPSGARLAPALGLVARSASAGATLPSGLWLFDLNEPYSLRRVTPAMLAAEGAEPTTITPAAWSPDGAQVAFVARGPDYGVRVLTIGADADDLREVTHLTDVGSVITALAYSADGAYLAAQVSGVDGQAAMSLVTNLATGAQMSEPLPGHAGLAWSPAGHLLALVTDEGVKVRNLDTGAVRWVTLLPCDYVAWYRVPPNG